MCEHPDPELCERLGRHIHGRMYRLYVEDPAWRERLEKVASGKRLSVLNKAANFATAVLKHVANGLAKASDEEIAERLKVCDGCDRQQEGQCGACGCVIAIKATWASETCPLFKWAGDADKVGCGCSGK